MSEVVVFRPKSNLIWGTVALVLDAMFLLQLVFYPVGTGLPWIEIGIFIATAAMAICLWVRPKLILEKSQVVVVNPLSIRRISYSEITDLETKWTLLIRHGDQSTRVWVAPASGKHSWIAENTQRWIFTSIPLSDRGEAGVGTVSSSLRSDSGIAAQLIRERLSQKH